MAQARLALQEVALVSPGSGTVAEVYGAEGEYLGPDGVHQYAAPQAVPEQPVLRHPAVSGPDLTLDSGSATGNVEPLVEVIGGDQQVMAQVPESNVSKFPIGHTASVSIAALRLRRPPPA